MSRVMIVDDDPDVRDMLRKTFERAGFEVSVAADGDEGLALYKHERPDVVVTDIIMPDREGIETMIDIKTMDPKAKIIAISGGGRVNTVDFLTWARNLGVVGRALESIPCRTENHA